MKWSAALTSLKTTATNRKVCRSDLLYTTDQRTDAYYATRENNPDKTSRKAR